MAEPGTLEQIALLVGDALAPLAQELAPDRALGLLDRLGLTVPGSALTPQLGSAFGACAAAAGQLPDLIDDLSGSIEADAGGLEIGAKSAPLVAAVVRVIDALSTIGHEVQALTGTGLGPEIVTAFAAALPGRLLEYLVVSNLERSPALSSALGLIGLVENVRENVGSFDPAHPEIERKTLRLDRIGTLLSSPETVLGDVYGWGRPGFTADVLLDRLYDLLTGVGLPIARGVVDVPARRKLDFFLARIAGTPPAVTPPGLEVILQMPLAEGFELALPIADGVEFTLRAQAGLGFSAGLRLQPPADMTVIAEGSVQGSLTSGVAVTPRPGKDAVQLFGVAGATGLSARRIEIGLATRFAWDTGSGTAKGAFGLEGKVEGGRFVVSLAGADGFIGSIMGGFALESNFDLGFGCKAGAGVYFTGSGGLEIKLPSHIELGPVEVMGLGFSVGIAPAGLPIALTADIKGALGPMSAVVEGLGVEALVAFPADHSGNLGPVDLSFRFKPPNGVGLALDVGIVKGGGYLRIDVPRGEYSGALELVFADFLSLSAIGLITTKNPDGSPGFSLLIIITAEFPGGIQLGFGFTLLGVGGLLGVNRTMNLEALMLGVRTNAVESVMFPHDVVANAPRIISDLRTFFPAKQGTFLIGPMVKLGWGTPTLISVSVGVIIEIPGNIAIVGILKVALPTSEAALIKLQVNFAGAIEFDKKRLFFFAALYDSRILFMTLEGEMGLLVAWGDEPSFVVSVGGFHPSFTPPPLPFPSPRRIVVSILDTDVARIRVTNYFAVTSNTVQFGASSEMYFGFSAISIEGHFGFDVLFQFSPFHFVVEISGGVSLKVFGMGVFSISLHFQLEGTSPWRAKGEGSISFFFFDVSADFDITWGEPKDTQLDPVDVLPALAAELAKPESWRALLPSGTNLQVTLRDLAADPAGESPLVLHPLGTLEVRQRAVPLDLTIGKLGANAVRDVNRVTLAATAGFVKKADVSEQFALAQFLPMDDAAKLSRPSFERQHAGIELTSSGSAPGTARTVRRVVRYEEVVIDNAFRRRRRRFRPITGPLFDHLLAGGSVALAGQSMAQAQLKDPHGDAIKVAASPGYLVASIVDNTRITETFASEASALEHLRTLDANAAAAAHVIPSVEVNEVVA
jgi:hypothetical protein